MVIWLHDVIVGMYRVVSCSRGKSEYHAIAKIAHEMISYHFLLYNLGFTLLTLIPIYSYY